MPFTEWSEEAGTWVDVANADELRLQDKREKAGIITRSQLLTSIELQLGYNKTELLEIADHELTGAHLIKVRNAISETQSFTLVNDDIWDFFTQTLNLSNEDIFKLWEEAKKNN